MAGIIPTQIATENVNCVSGKYWNIEGIVSNQMILQGIRFICYTWRESCFFSYIQKVEIQRRELS